MPTKIEGILEDSVSKDRIDWMVYNKIGRGMQGV